MGLLVFATEVVELLQSLLKRFELGRNCIGFNRSSQSGS